MTIRPNLIRAVMPHVSPQTCLPDSGKMESLRSIVKRKRRCDCVGKRTQVHTTKSPAYADLEGAQESNLNQCGAGFIAECRAFAAFVAK
jgi:hypothetical protein